MAATQFQGGDKLISKPCLRGVLPPTRAVLIAVHNSAPSRRMLHGCILTTHALDDPLACVWGIVDVHMLSVVSGLYLHCRKA